MDLTRSRLRLPDGFRIWARVRSLPKISLRSFRPEIGLRRFSRLCNSRIAQRGLTAALLLGALLTGVWAHDLDRELAIHDWLQSHFPSEKAVGAGLSALGASRVQRSSTVQNIMKTMPAEFFTDPGVLWVSSSGLWAALLIRQEGRDAMNRTEFFCRDCSSSQSHPPNTADWKRLSFGWPGLEAAIKAMAESKLPGRRPEPHDPKEIFY